MIQLTMAEQIMTQYTPALLVGIISMAFPLLSTKIFEYLTAFQAVVGIALILTITAIMTFLLAAIVPLGIPLVLDSSNTMQVYLYSSIATCLITISMLTFSPKDDRDYLPISLSAPQIIIAVTFV
jgi:hypothetical protein